MGEKGYLQYFYDMAEIPRCSGNESRLSDYLVAFAKEHNLSCHKDAFNNVIIKKKATEGYETSGSIILQGHIDMVGVKTPDSNHDFDTDSVQLRREGDLIKGVDTSIGADNGVGAAYCLDVLARSDMKHPELEVVFTTNEETTMGGALNLDFSMLSSKRMINLDNEIEGKVLVSSAGGICSTHLLDVKRERMDEGKKTVEIKIFGLLGGHSGLEIHIGRANANILLGRILNSINRKYKMDLLHISGGSKVNAITLESQCIIAVDGCDVENVFKEIEKQATLIKMEYQAVDPNLKIECQKSSSNGMKVTDQVKEGVIALLTFIPAGIHTMDKHLKTLVESSSNLGIVKTYENEITFASEIRSSSETILNYLIEKNELLSQLVNTRLILEHRYPSWPYKPDSELATKALSVFENNNINNCEIIAEHAGIECGVFIQNIQGLDAISIGPNIYDCHTTNECFSISSAEKVYKALVELLEEFR